MDCCSHQNSALMFRRLESFTKNKHHIALINHHHKKYKSQYKSCSETLWIKIILTLIQLKKEKEGENVCQGLN